MSTGEAGTFSDNSTIDKEPQNFVDWRRVSIYQVMRDLYNATGGIGGVRDGAEECSFIIPNTEERYYQTRVMLTPFAPWFTLFIDSQYEPLYTEKAPIPEVTEAVVPFLSDVNRAGMSIDDYKQDVSKYSIMDGVVFLASGYDSDPKKYPWFMYYEAPLLNKKLTGLDEFGAVETYVFTETLEDKTYQHDVYTGNTFQQFTSSDYDKLGTAKEDEVNSMSIKPIYSQRREQNKLLPSPKNKGITGLCVSLYNSESDQRWLVRVQGHSIFVVVSDIAPNGIGDGLTTGLHIDATENQGNASYVSPPADLSKEQRESKADILGQLFDFMHHHGVIAVKSSQIPESGASKAFTFRPVDVAMGKAKTIAKEVDAYVVESFKYYRKMDIQFEFEYKEKFTPRSPLDIVDLVTVLSEFKRAGVASGVIDALKQIALSIGADTELLEEIDNLNADQLLIEKDADGE